MKRTLYIILVFFLLTILFRLTFSCVIDRYYNRINESEYIEVSEKAKSLHKKFFIVDLHCDMLLWDRDFLKHNSYGHVDLPRMEEGNMAIQMFTSVTKVPFDATTNKSSGSSDMISFLAVSQGCPVKTWFSLKQRALYQSEKLHRFAGLSNGRFIIIKNKNDLSHFLKERNKKPDITAGLLGIEGAHALDNEVKNIYELFDAGFRMVSLAHFFDNDFGGSAHGIKKGGLPDKGKELVKIMEKKGILLDLSHSSPACIDDILKIVTRPVVASHTGAKGVCDNLRNLSDNHIKRIAETGGVIGMGFWPVAVCGKDINHIVKTIKYVAALTSVRNVALGSDFDGAVSVPFDMTGLVRLTDALLKEGFSENDIRLIMGGNALRVLKQALP